MGSGAHALRLIAQAKPSIRVHHHVFQAASDLEPLTDCAVPGACDGNTGSQECLVAETPEANGLNWARLGSTQSATTPRRELHNA